MASCDNPMFEGHVGIVVEVDARNEPSLFEEMKAVGKLESEATLTVTMDRRSSVGSSLVSSASSVSLG